MAIYETTTVSEVNAVFFSGDNVEEVVELFDAPDFLLTEGTIQGEEVTILMIRYLDNKDNLKKITIHNGQYIVAGKSGYKVVEQDKFENKYTLVD